MTNTKRLIALFVLIGVLAGSVAFFMPTREASAIRTCRQEPENLAPKCYTDLIETTLSDRGLASALRVVLDVSAVDKAFGVYCHSNMHDLGKAAYDMYHEKGTIDILPELSYCGYGFYHGFMEKMFAETGTLDGAHAFCNAIASELANPHNAVSNCYHGIGHGITDGYDPLTYKNAPAIVGPGLGLCTQISPDEEMHRSCALGVFNSIELMYEDPKSKLTLPEDPFDLCRGDYTPLEKDACYLEFSVLVKGLSKDDIGSALRYARNAEPEYRARTVTYLALFLTGGFDPVDVLAACREVVPLYSADCIKGIAQGTLQFGAPEHEFDGGVAFCSGDTLNTSERERCATVLVTTNMNSAADIARACKRLPTDLQPQVCRGV